MRFQDSVKDGCPISGKETTLTRLNLTPHIPKESKTTSHRRRDGILPRAA